MNEPRLIDATALLNHLTVLQRENEDQYDYYQAMKRKIMDAPVICTSKNVIDKDTAIDNIYAAAESIICAVEEEQPEIVEKIVDVRDAILKKIEEQPTAESRQVLTKTNADRIRAMTDEELARFLENTRGCSICFLNAMADECTGFKSSMDCITNKTRWLKQEVSEDDIQ